MTESGAHLAGVHPPMQAAFPYPSWAAAGLIHWGVGSTREKPAPWTCPYCHGSRTRVNLRFGLECSGCAAPVQEDA